jgi:ketosteroid isomerase-like protein
VEQELVALEKQYWQAIKERNVDAALRLTDDPCLVADAQGVRLIDRQAFAAMMSGTSFTVHDVEVKDDVEVRLLRYDVATVAYTVHEDLTVDGEPVTLDAVDTSTWVRRDGRWVCAMHTESILGDPFGRDRDGR